VVDPSKFPLPNPFVNPTLRRTVASFAAKKGAEYFPLIAGAIDGLMIRIRCPSKDGKKYFGRKGYHCLNFIGMCDGDARILCYSCRHAGATPDTLALRTSPLQAALDAGLLPQDHILLGDEAFSANHPQIH